MEGQRPQQVFLMPLLVGTDGVQKMSKSLDNYIAVEENPNDMYGKVLSIPDAIIINYFELLTDIPDAELDEYRKSLADNSVNPMELKKKLAREIVEQFHNKQAAADAQAHFEKTVQKKELPDEMSEISIQEIHQLHLQEQDKLSQSIDIGEKIKEADISDSISISMSTGAITASIPLIISHKGLVKSKGEARRLMTQGAISIVHPDGSRNDIFKEDDRPFLRVGDVIKVGKRRFVKIVDADKT
jgi:tyrosyl-tRNA synthetase